MNARDLITDSSAYLAEKRRDPATSSPSLVADLLRALDCAVIDHLNHGGAYAAVDAAIDAIMAHPGHQWTRDTIAYYIRVRHYS